MNLETEINREHSKRNTIRVATMIGNDDTLLRQLVNLTLGTNEDLARKAAWVLRYSHENISKGIIPWLPKLIRHLQKGKIHPAVKRNILGIVKSVPIPPKYMGTMLDICFRYIESAQEPVAVKVFSIDIIAGMAGNQPDLLNELKLILEDQLPFGSAGFKSKAFKVIKNRNSKLSDYEN